MPRIRFSFAFKVLPSTIRYRNIQDSAGTRAARASSKMDAGGLNGAIDGIV